MHTHQLLEDTWARSVTNLLEEWTDIQKEDTHQDVADLLQEDVIDMNPMMIEIVTTVEETDTTTETDTEIVTEEGNTEITIELPSKILLSM